LPTRIVKLGISLVVAAWDSLIGLVRRLVRRDGRPQVAILYYHEVRADRRERFSWQLDQLTRLARPVRADLRTPPRGRGRCAAITFDDAFVSVLENAVPELVRREIPFTVFAPSGNLGDRPRWIVDPNHPCYHERVMTGAQLRELSATGLAVIGSHGVAHANLESLTDAESELEITQSSRELEAILDHPVELLSFPHGAYQDRHVAMARGSGYRRAYSILPDSGRLFTSEFVVGRVHAETEDWRIETLLKLRCAYRWLPFAFAAKRALTSLLGRGSRGAWSST
jgi:peptidoglycan/xylan/chitin deacetylase (PgdA/CDA1 family)